MNMIAQALLDFKSDNQHLSNFHDSKHIYHTCFTLNIYLREAILL